MQKTSKLPTYQKYLASKQELIDIIYTLCKIFNLLLLMRTVRRLRSPLHNLDSSPMSSIFNLIASWFSEPSACISTNVNGENPAFSTGES